MADCGAAAATGRSRAPLRRYLRYAAVWTVGAAPSFAVLTALWLYPAEFEGIGEIALGAFALMFPIAVRELRVERRTEFVYFLLVAGLAFAVVSVVTGAANSLTDQPYTTPQFVTVLLRGQDPYGTPLTLSYVQYGRVLPFRSVYPFLPLLMFLQVPGLNYKWFALACWVGLVLVARRRFDTAVMLGQPYLVIVASNGYNDLAVLLLLTLGFVGWEGRRLKWAEWLSLGGRQLANVLVVAYYVVRRDWGNVLVTIGVSAAFIVPFVLWSGAGVLCPALTANRLTGCGPGGLVPSLQLDDFVWVIWAVAVFYTPFVGALRRRAATGWVARRLLGVHLSFDDLLRLPAFLVVGVSGVFVNLCVFTLLGLQLTGLAAAVYLSSVGAFGVALCWNFSWNRAWAFAGRGGRSTAYHLGLYGVIQAGVLAVNLVVLATAVGLGGSDLEGQIVGIVSGSVLGYAANLRWNFRASSARTPAG